MYNIIAKSRTKDAQSGKVYTVTLRKWDMAVSPYEVVYEVGDSCNDPDPMYKVYEYGDFEHAHEMFLYWTDNILHEEPYDSDTTEPYDSDTHAMLKMAAAEEMYPDYDVDEDGNVYRC